MKAGKVWGETESLLVTPLVEVHHIKVNQGGICSTHLHRFKWNMFYVISGHLDIEVRKSDYDLEDVTELKAGEWTTVPPGEFHRFRALEDTEALEIYYLEPISKDIVRENVGGLVDSG
jgi:mannose-6-phosphate isomerase-like protein (cupin superfamily)